MPEPTAGSSRCSTRPMRPHIVKDTTLPFRLGQLLEAGTVSVSHVIVPIRSLDLAAASRVRGLRLRAQHLCARRSVGNGRIPVKQRDALAAMLYELMFTIAKLRAAAHACSSFPASPPTGSTRTARSRSSRPIALPEEFRDALAAVVRPDLIHEEPLRARRAPARPDARGAS